MKISYSISFEKDQIESKIIYEGAEKTYAFELKPEK